MAACTVHNIDLLGWGFQVDTRVWYIFPFHTLWISDELMALNCRLTAGRVWWLLDLSSSLTAVLVISCVCILLRLSVCGRQKQACNPIDSRRAQAESWSARPDVIFALCCFNNNKKKKKNMCKSNKYATGRLRENLNNNSGMLLFHSLHLRAVVSIVRTSSRHYIYPYG